MTTEVDDEILKELILTNKHPRRYSQFKYLFTKYRLCIRVWDGMEDYDYFKVSEDNNLNAIKKTKQDYLEHPEWLSEEAKKHAIRLDLLDIQEFDEGNMKYYCLWD